MSAERRWTAAGLGLLIAAATACAPAVPDASAGATNPAGVVVSTINDDTTYRGAEPRPPYRMPDVTLTDTDGKPFNLLDDTTSPVTLVFFGYTHCPDVCPLVMSDLTAAVLQSPAQVRNSTQLLFITTDPARDTPAVLRRYLDRYDSDFVGLTGGLAQIRAAGTALGVAVGGRHRLPSGGYDVSHGTQVIGFQGDAAPVVWTVGTPVADLVADLTTLAESRPSG